MQRLEVSCAVRPIYGSLGAKGFICLHLLTWRDGGLVHMAGRRTLRILTANQRNEKQPQIHVNYTQQINTYLTKNTYLHCKDHPLNAV
jgi:hypothetical protein